MQRYILKVLITTMLLLNIGFVHAEYTKSELEHITASADNGDIAAQNILGLFHFDNGDLHKAEIWLKKSADQGVIGAQGLIFSLYMQIEDDEKALEYGQMLILNKDYKSHAINNGDVEMLLASIYIEKIDIEYYAKMAVKMYQYASDKGKLPATMSLGIAYSNGTGVNKDIKKGFMLLKESAEKGYVDSYIRLAMKYRDGNGTKKDITKYFEWANKSINHDNNLGQLILGIDYVTGTNGITKNSKKGLTLIRKSAENGNLMAKDFLNKFESSVERSTKKENLTLACSVYLGEEKVGDFNYLIDFNTSTANGWKAKITDSNISFTKGKDLNIVINRLTGGFRGNIAGSSAGSAILGECQKYTAKRF